MAHALSALLHYLPRLSRRLHPPPPTAHPPGSTIYQDKTERIGATRPLHFPRNGTFRCTSGSFWSRVASVKKNNRETGGEGGCEGSCCKKPLEFSQQCLSLVRSQPWWQVTRVCPLPSRPRFTSPAPLVSPYVLPPPLFSLLSSVLPSSPHLTPSVCLSVSWPRLRRSPSSLSRIQSIFSPAWWPLDEASHWLVTVMKTEILFPGWPLRVFPTSQRACRGVIDALVVVCAFPPFALIDVSVCL